MGHAIQHDSPPEQFQALVDEWDFGSWSQGFHINLIASRGDDHAHLRMPSEQGLRAYIGGRGAALSPLKPVPFGKRIAVIHRWQPRPRLRCQRDCELWLTRLATPERG